MSRKGSMKPILFNTEMVKTILSGKKIMTRRKVDTDISNKFDCEADGTPIAFIEQSTGDHYKPTDPCRYQPGDILYVRETWQIGFKESAPCSIDTWNRGNACVPCYRSKECSLMESHPFDYLYKASPETYKDDYDEFPWRPSIHMPKEAARLFLKVIGIRVERLQDISCVDAEMEGVSSTVYWTPNEMDNRPFEEKWWDDYHFWTHYPQVAFSRLWDSTVDKSDINKYGWDANPWVWVISFERIGKEEAI